jgi:histidyl-tRNA synthetase
VKGMRVFSKIRGVKDLYGQDLEKYEYLVKSAMDISSSYGFSTIETPILEHEEVFLRTLGVDSDVVHKEMYSFIDKSGNSIALRPEGTAGVMRAVVELGLSPPIKLAYSGPMFRYSRPQANRYRQFHQIGFEWVEEPSPYIDGSAILLVSDILREVGVSNFKVKINSLGNADERKLYSDDVKKYFSIHESDLSDDSKRRLKSNPLRILDSKDKKDIEIALKAPKLREYMMNESSEYFSKVCEILTNNSINYAVDDLLVRGLDYYSHTVFEVTVEGSSDSILGGGRYDDLLKDFGGPSVSGIGFAIGAERLMTFITPTPKTPLRVGVISVSNEEEDYSFEIMRLLQKSKIQTEMIFGKTVSKKLKFASKKGYEAAIIIGEEEKSENCSTIKFLKTNSKEEKEVKISKDEIIDFLIRKRPTT